MCLSTLLSLLRPIPGKGLAMATVDWAYLVERVARFVTIWWAQLLIIFELAVIIGMVAWVMWRTK